MNPLRRDNDPDSGRNRESRRPSRGGPPRRPPVPVPPGRPFRTMAFWALVVLLSLVAYRMYQGSFMAPQRADISYTRFVQEVDKGNIKTMQVMGKTVTGEFKGDASLKVNGHDLAVRHFKTSILGDGTDIRDRVWAADPEVEIQVQEEGINWVSVLFTWLPLIVVFGVWLFLIRQMQSGGSAALKFGKTKAKVLIESSPKVTFKDVAGCDEAKQELQEVIDFLKEPQKFQRLGGRIPKGALMLGPPGSGKTLLAKAVAGEAGVPFFSMSGSDFVEMFVGVGASVTGDTPVLVRHDGHTALREIGEFVDSFYEGDQADFVVPVKDLETLGFEEKDSKFKGSRKVFVKGSGWKKARAVYRHRVSEIHEIHHLGGVLRTTGDHSVFVRTRDGIKPRAARDLQPGDVLVQLPMKVRGEWSKSEGTPHEVRGHAFDDSGPLPSLGFRPRDEAREADYAFALEQRGAMSQAAIGAAIGVSQMTVGNWQRRIHVPRELQPHVSDVLVPESIPVTPDLMRLFGYYTAEGRDNGCVQFVFGSHEPDLHQDLIERMRRVFEMEPTIDQTEDHTTRITYYSAPLGRFFSRHCGTGSRAKHVPEVLWNLPYEYFLAFLTGYSLGDGYTTKEGKLSVTSVSRRLIRELTWLCAMHGIPCGVRRMEVKPGRVIKSNPLPATEAWNLIVGKTSHPLAKHDGPAKQGKRPVVQRVIVKPYDGYVYDLCGCDNEAFFGGEKPMLLHNSRVRDLFEQGKRNAPCLTGDAVVTLSGGKQVTIEEMFERQMVGVKVPTMSEDFRFEDATVIGITRKPAPDLFEITTSTSSVKATGNHLFPKLEGTGVLWVPAARLRQGDHLAAPRTLPDTSGNAVASARRHPGVPRSVPSGDLASTVTVLEEVMDLGHPDVVWVPIQQIKSIPAGGPVYDLCLDRNHNFVVNRLFTHNCIIFIDEIDAVGRHRGAGLGGGHDEREQTLNQLLVEMDGFDSNEGVIMIAATNRPDVLDPALLRPGRFDRQIVVDWPDVRGREGILKVHTRKIPLSEDVELRQIARATPGMAGADIANLVNEAALLAARRNLKKVGMREFEDAKDKVLLGTERKSLVMSEEERRSTAYHEAGHALVAWLLPGSEPVDKVTIIPRGRALGVTSYLPHEDRHSRSKDDLIRTLCMMMGGRAAEYIVFNHLTTGASNDLERATALARKMVCELGMSENLGPLTFGKKDEMVFLGREIATHKDYSEQTAVQIDQEVRSMVEGQYNRALELLRENIDKLHLLAKTLLEREVIDGDQMNRVLKGETLEPIRPADAPGDEEPKLKPAPDTPRKDEGPFDALGPAPSPSGA